MKAIQFLYTEIGRGHPFYLDGIKYFLNKNRIEYSSTDVFKQSRGLSFWLWKLIYQLYISGSSGNLIGRLYKFIRGSKHINHSDFLLSVLGRSITINNKADDSALIVAHPLLVKILSPKTNLFYQHGETVVPLTELPKGASQLFVPTKEVADKFICAGYDNSQIHTTGLCIDPELIERAETRFEYRIKRIEEADCLCGAFFSSGAEPSRHVRTIVETVLAVMSAGGKAIVFCKKKGRLSKQMSNLLADNNDLTIECKRSLNIVTFDSREEETALTGNCFDLFDYFVAPSHERSNWALGLGLPLFILTPHYGSFAPLNRDKLLGEGVAMELENTGDIGQLANIVSKKEKREILSKMSYNGWGKYAIDGFQKISDFMGKV